MVALAVKRALFCLGLAGLMAAPGVASAQSAAHQLAAAATTSPSWQLVADQPQPSGVGQLVSVFAKGPNSAWAGGASGYQPLIEHWNGTTWTNVTPTGRAFRTNGTTVDGIGASSAANVWGMVESATNGYAMRFNGTSWTKYSFHRYLTDTGIAVESRKNVWAFGMDGDYRPFVRHFNGTRWSYVRVPAVPLAESSAAWNDIDAVGPTTSSFCDSCIGTARDVLMHWNGKAWRSVKLPGLSMTKKEYFTPNGIVATRTGGAWITGDVEGTANSQVRRHRLLHWTGKTWKVYSSPVWLGPVTTDGHRGLWMTDITLTASTPTSFVHFADGKFTLTTVPLPPSPVAEPSATMSGITLIPGTTSAWAVGEFLTDGTDAIIYRYSS